MNSKKVMPSWLYILTTALAPMIWGSTYIVTTELLPPDRPFTAAFIRAFPAGLLLILFIRRLPKRQQWIRLLILSALNIGFFQSMLFIAAYRLPGGLAAVLSAIQPLLIMAMIWIIDHQRPAQLAIWSSVLGGIGMAVLLLSPNTVWEPVGIIAALLGSVSMAVGTYLTRRWKLDMPVLALTGWQLLVGGLLLAPMAWFTEPSLPALDLTQMLAYGYLSLIGALLAYGLWFRGIANLSPVAVSSLGLLSPLTAVILGWILLGQSMTGTSLLGLLVVLGSILAVQWAMARRAQ